MTEASPELCVRRIVTGHDANGRAVVTSDGAVPDIISRANGQLAGVVWTTSRLPADNLTTPDAISETAPASLEGAAFRVVRYAAGCAGRMHRTRSLDFGVVLSGCVALELDDGAEVTLQAGDLLVQRGTIHRWINRGPEPCTIAFVLIEALPLPFD